jgi:hypothetical protein
MYQTVPGPSTRYVSWSVIDIPDDTTMSDATEEIAILSDKTGKIVRHRFMQKGKTEQESVEPRRTNAPRFELENDME